MTRDPSTSAADPVEAITDLIERGEDDAAFAELRAHFGWPAGKAIARGELARWLGIVAALAGRREIEPLVDAANEAVRDPDSPDGLYDLGYALIDAGAPDLAASVLWHCLALVGQSEEVVCELVSALESSMDYEDAFAVLDDHAALRQHSFMCRYLHAFNAAMTGRLDVVRTAATALAPETPEHEPMARRIAAFVTRAERIAGATPLDARDLRGWHYVLGGGLLLHQSPYGFDAPMHGRYAWLRDSYARVAFGIARLAELTRGLRLECVYAPPGRDHEILALAVSERLGLPVMPWPAVGVPAPGLVALYDLADLAGADVARLVERRADQVVFAHATPWTVDVPVAPDVTTLLYQALVPPWGESMVVATTGELAKAPPDARPAAAIAQEILSTPPLEGEELAADDPARYAALVAQIWPLELGSRSRLWAGGPVPSSRFT